MMTQPARRSAIHRPPPSVDEVSLLLQVSSSQPPTVIDIRETPAFQEAHIVGAVNIPGSSPTPLINLIQESRRVVVVCGDGSHAATVVRMLGVCGFPDVEYLKGGMNAWSAMSASLARTARDGEEVTLHQQPDPEEQGIATRFFSLLTTKLLWLGLTGSGLFVSLFLLLKGR